VTDPIIPDQMMIAEEVVLKAMIAAKENQDLQLQEQKMNFLKIPKLAREESLINLHQEQKDQITLRTINQEAIDLIHLFTNQEVKDQILQVTSQEATDQIHLFTNQEVKDPIHQVINHAVKDQIIPDQEAKNQILLHLTKAAATEITVLKNPKDQIILALLKIEAKEVSIQNQAIPAIEKGLAMMIPEVNDQIFLHQEKEVILNLKATATEPDQKMMVIEEDLILTDHQAKDQISAIEAEEVIMPKKAKVTPEASEVLVPKIPDQILQGQILLIEAENLTAENLVS
jgi:hypothetical protein